MFVFEFRLYLIFHILRYIESRSQFEKFPWNLLSKIISVRIEYGLSLFGSKKDSSESTKQKEKEQENQITESEEKSTKAMSTIQSTIADLNTK